MGSIELPVTRPVANMLAPVCAATMPPCAISTTSPWLAVTETTDMSPADLVDVDAAGPPKLAVSWAKVGAPTLRPL